MGIQYSGNAQIFSYSTGASTPATDMETNLVTDLVIAGWTNTRTAASDVLTFSAQPVATSTFTLDGSPNAQTYTFVASGPTGNQILIDTTLANTLANVTNALNAGPGAGTKYGTTLTQPPNMTGANTATTVTVTYKTLGSAGNGAPVSTSGTINATWATSTLLGGGNTLLSAITPQGLQSSVAISTAAGSFYNPGTTLSLIPGNRDRSRVGNDMCNGTPNTSTAFRLIANKYQWINFTPGTSASSQRGNGMAMGCPYITSNLAAPTIVSATNASPIVCNIPSHGFSNAQSVLIVGGLGNTNVNGIFTITFIDTNNFSLNSSTGNGTYVANSAYCSNLTLGNSIAEAIWTNVSSGGGPGNFRNGAYVANSLWSCVNANSIVNDNSSANPQIVLNVSNDNGLTSVLQWYDNTYVLAEAFIAWGISHAAQSKIIGQLWDATVVRAGLNLDQTATFDNPAHNWWTIGTANNNALLFATS